MVGVARCRHVTPATPDNLEQSGKLFRVLAFVIRDLHHHLHVQIQPKEDVWQLSLVGIMHPLIFLRFCGLEDLG